MKAETERRAWERLPLPIPLFVRGVDGSGKEFLEFTVALNLSAGGALVVCHHPLARSARLSLEIPSGPAPKFPLPEPARSLRARVIRTITKDVYNLHALSFNRPLI